MDSLTLVLLWTALGALGGLALARHLRGPALALPILAVLLAGISEAAGRETLERAGLILLVALFVLASLTGALAGLIALSYARELAAGEGRRSERRRAQEERERLEAVMREVEACLATELGSAAARRRYIERWEALGSALRRCSTPLERTRSLVASYEGADAASAAVAGELRLRTDDELLPALTAVREASNLPDPAPGRGQRLASRVLGG